MHLFFFISSIHVLDFFFFFNDTATTEIYTLSLHDALPISVEHHAEDEHVDGADDEVAVEVRAEGRSEEHTSELQSHLNLVCRLLLEKKKRIQKKNPLRHHKKHEIFNR